MLRNVAAIVALLTAALAVPRNISAGEGGSKGPASSVSSGHREAVQERASSWSAGKDDDDDDDSDKDKDKDRDRHHSSDSGRGHSGSTGGRVAAAAVGGLLAGMFSAGGGHGGGSAPEVEVRGNASFLDDDEGGYSDSSGSAHSWLSHGQGMMSRINVGVTRYDDRGLREAASYEWQLHGKVYKTWGVGITLGGGWGPIGTTGSLSRGDLETGLVLASTSVDIPLGKGRAPILSLGGGVGGYYADPDVASDTRDDLAALGLRLEQGHHWFLDKRARADLLVPLDRERLAYLGLGVVRDWADGDITTTLRDINTGAAVSKDRAHMDFDRTTFQLSLVLIF